MVKFEPDQICALIYIYIIYLTVAILKRFLQRNSMAACRLCAKLTKRVSCGTGGLS